MLLREFDRDNHAVIEPKMIFPPVADFPETVISVFSHELFILLLRFWAEKSFQKPVM